MAKLKGLEGYMIYRVGIEYQNTGTDPAIAALHSEMYCVLGKDEGAVIQKAEEQFRKDFSDKTITKTSARLDINLEECLIC